MNRALPLQLFKMSTSDPTRLLVLKSQFNRHALKLNSFDRYLSEHEKQQLFTILTYLHSQIGVYEEYGQVK
jgi:hypothetical protein